MTRRSYPACLPVRTASINANGGGDVRVMNAEACEQTNGVASGDAVGPVLGLGVVAGVVVGVTLTWPPGMSGPRLSGLPTTRTPTRMTAITAAATAAIHTGPRP